MLTTDNKLKTNVKGILINTEKLVKLLGVTVDNKLFFSLILIWYFKRLVKNSTLEFHKVYFKEKANSYYESIYNLAIQLLSFGMDFP